MTGHYEIASDFKDAYAFLDAFTKELAARGVHNDIIFDIKVAAAEALVNAIKYGNQNKKGLTVTIDTKVNHDRVELCIKDRGKGFDHTGLEDPTDESHLTRTRGRGVFLIKKLMDTVEFSDNGSTIKMVKSITRQEERQS